MSQRLLRKVTRSNDCAQRVWCFHVPSQLTETLLEQRCTMEAYSLDSSVQNWGKIIVCTGPKNKTLMLFFVCKFEVLKGHKTHALGLKLMDLDPKTADCGQIRS